MKWSKKLEKIAANISAAQKAGVSSEKLEQQFLGRKGELTLFLRSLGAMSAMERAEAGKAANALKVELESSLGPTKKILSEQVSSFDPTVPAYPSTLGGVHPISAMIEEMVSIFQDLSFEVAEGKEIVSEYENFETLNIGTDHPARDSHQSFFLKDDLLLRTQTTAVQVLEMNKRQKKGELPIRIVVPGKTYRRESDQTHSAMFHQIDAVMVDTQTTFADLRGCLDYFAKRLFGDTVETRFRPHYFPFTEPSAEMDIRWKGKVEREGKHTSWLEMGGCGMIHPKVLHRAGINPRIYQGWAFGMSIERPLMVRHQIPDLRLLFNNSLNLLEQIATP